jgi:hypothetical protein
MVRVVLEERRVVWRRHGVHHSAMVRKVAEVSRVWALRCRQCDDVVAFVDKDLGPAATILSHGGCSSRRGYCEPRCAELVTLRGEPVHQGRGWTSRRRAILGTRPCRAPLPCPVHGPR